MPADHIRLPGVWCPSASSHFFFRSKFLNACLSFEQVFFGYFIVFLVLFIPHYIQFNCSLFPSFKKKIHYLVHNGQTALLYVANLVIRNLEGKDPTLSINECFQDFKMLIFFLFEISQIYYPVHFWG